MARRELVEIIKQIETPKITALQISKIAVVDIIAPLTSPFAALLAIFGFWKICLKDPKPALPINSSPPALNEPAPNPPQANIVLKTDWVQTQRPKGPASVLNDPAQTKINR